MRTTPDVSIIGGSGEPVDTVNSGATLFAGTKETFAGTSLSSPCWAALIADADQGRALSGLGSLTGSTETLPMLYALPSYVFHDITTGFTGYNAGPGYDLLTGLGSPKAPLVAAGLGGVVASGGFNVSALRAVTSNLQTVATFEKPRRFFRHDRYQLGRWLARHFRHDHRTECERLVSSGRDSRLRAARRLHDHGDNLVRPGDRRDGHQHRDRRPIHRNFATLDRNGGRIVDQFRQRRRLRHRRRKSDHRLEQRTSGNSIGATARCNWRPGSTQQAGLALVQARRRVCRPRHNRAGGFRSLGGAAGSSSERTDVQEHQDQQPDGHSVAGRVCRRNSDQRRVESDASSGDAYILQGGGLNVTGKSSLSGAGVMIYNASTNGGQINFSGTSAVTLSAPTGGAYQGIVFFQNRASNAPVVLGSGNVTVNLTGVVYAPGAPVVAGGSSNVLIQGDAANGISGALIAYDLSKSGDGQLTVDASADVAPGALPSLFV